MPRARRPPRQRAAEQRKRDNNPSDVHERQRVDIPDRQNDRATAAKMSGTRDILGREGGGGEGRAKIWRKNDHVSRMLTSLLPA